MNGRIPYHISGNLYISVFALCYRSGIVERPSVLPVALAIEPRTWTAARVSLVALDLSVEHTQVSTFVTHDSTCSVIIIPFFHGTSSTRLWIDVKVLGGDRVMAQKSFARIAPAFRLEVPAVVAAVAVVLTRKRTRRAELKGMVLLGRGRYFVVEARSEMQTGVVVDLVDFVAWRWAVRMYIERAMRDDHLVGTAGSVR